jgi:aminotransferase EvaB
MTIGVWGYLDEYEDERCEIQDAIRSVLESGQLILGPQVTSFEEEYASYCGIRHAVGVGNGTDAITIGLRALGVGPGDEVITVSNTAVPTVSAIVDTGATPRFVDIDPNTYLMNVDLIGDLINDNTKCLLPVHLFGQCVDMDSLLALAKKHHLKVFEDCAQSHGALYKGRMAGSMGDVSSTSFYPTKILSTYGDGGMVMTQDEKTKDRIRRLRFYGMDERYFSIENGTNSRLDEIHAAILRKKLRHLPRYLRRRQEIATAYDEGLGRSSLKLPTCETHNTHSHYIYVVSHPNRDDILKELLEYDICLNVSYKWPIHTMPPYREFLIEGQSLPETEAAANRIFSLPMYPSLKDEDQAKVIAILQEF